jgi:hypothetical protein
MGHPDKDDLVTAHEADDRDDRAMTRDSAIIHARYMSERPGSCGYFGPNPDHAPDPDEVARTLRRHTGPIWRHFVSVTEQDARTLGGGLLDRPAWEAAAHSVVPQMAKAMGIPATSLRWVAALHRKEGHPHLHLLIWEEPPKRERGELTQPELRGMKRAWVSALYQPELKRIGAEKSAVRQELLATARAQLSRRNAQELTERLTTLAEHLPGHGRISYKLALAPLKAELQHTSAWLLRASPELASLAQRYGDLAVDLARHYSDQPDQHEQARTKAVDELRERVANRVLRAAVELDRQTIRAEWAADPETDRAIESAIQQLAHRPHDSGRLAQRLADEILAARDARAAPRPVDRPDPAVLTGLADWRAAAQAAAQPSRTPPVSEVPPAPAKAPAIPDPLPDWKKAARQAHLQPTAPMPARPPRQTAEPAAVSAFKEWRAAEQATLDRAPRVADRQARERAWLADRLLREAHYRADQGRFQAAGLVAALSHGLEREVQRAEREAEAAALEAEAQRLREAGR